MLCFYRRIFGTIDTTFSTAVVSVAIFNFIAWIAVFSIFTFQCTPIIYTWDRTLVGGRCLPNNVLFWSTSSINIATDIVIVILPIPIVWSMRLTIYQKLAVTGVFLLGGLLVSSRC